MLTSLKAHYQEENAWHMSDHAANRRVSQSTEKATFSPRANREGAAHPPSHRQLRMSNFLSIASDVGHAVLPTQATVTRSSDMTQEL